MPYCTIDVKINIDLDLDLDLGTDLVADILSCLLDKARLLLLLCFVQTRFKVQRAVQSQMPKIENALSIKC
jgi:hypothetical protein